MDDKFLIANSLVPDNEVWVSPKTFENPFSKHISEALPKAPNKQIMPCLMYAGVNEQCDVFGDGRCGSLPCQLART
jgi:hypothetical protein